MTKVILVLLVFVFRVGEPKQLLQVASTGELATAKVSTIQNRLLRLTINDSMLATGTIVTARVFCTKKLRSVGVFCFDPSAEIFALLTEAPARTGNSALELIRSSKMSGSRAP